MIRTNLKNRMGDSLLDALMRSYRNSGHLQFWEPHLDNILFCHLDVMNCSTTNLVWKSKTGITPADVYNFLKILILTHQKHERRVSLMINLAKDVKEISAHINVNWRYKIYTIVGTTSPILTLPKRVNHRRNRREEWHRRANLHRKDGRLMKKIYLKWSWMINSKLLYFHIRPYQNVPDANSFLREFLIKVVTQFFP